MAVKNKIWKYSERILIMIIVIFITAVIVKAADRKLSKDNNAGNGNSECPEDMIFISAVGGGFCIDRYEASAGSDCPNAVPENQFSTLANLNYSGCVPVAKSDSLPWSNISQNQAAQACAKAGKRLPTNKEWQQAAMGTPDALKVWGLQDCHVSRNWSSQPGKSGSGKNCVSSSGVFDMIGNVWEWVDGTINEGEYKGIKLPDEGYILSVDGNGLPSETDQNQADENYYEDFFWIKKSGARAIARGGYWDNKTDAGQYSVYAVNSPAYVGIGVGFRCAK